MKYPLHITIRYIYRCSSPYRHAFVEHKARYRNGWSILGMGELSTSSLFRDPASERLPQGTEDRSPGLVMAAVLVWGKLSC